jgi:hypothetical protein
MKIRDLITEGMTFTAAKLKDYDGRKVWSSADWETKQLEPCFACDGTGKETWSDGEYPCRRCDGKGKSEEWVSAAPELQVSNSNGYEIQRMLGVTNPDYSGIIHNRDLPKFMRRLIQLKNQDTNQYTQEPSDMQGPMGKKHTDDQGVTHIGKTGPRMIDMGRSQDQVNHYIDKLIELIKFAQENDASISWG